MQLLGGAGGATAASGAGSAAAGAGTSAAGTAASTAAAGAASTAASTAANATMRSGAMAPKGLDLAGLLRDTAKETFSRENLASMIKDEAKPRSTYDPFKQKKMGFMDGFMRMMNE